MTDDAAFLIEMGGLQADYTRVIKEKLRVRLEEMGLLAKTYAPIEKAEILPTRI